VTHGAAVDEEPVFCRHCIAAAPGFGPFLPQPIEPLFDDDGIVWRCPIHGVVAIRLEGPLLDLEEIRAHQAAEEEEPPPAPSPPPLQLSDAEFLGWLAAAIVGGFALTFLVLWLLT
jgi:hypothetical protein